MGGKMALVIYRPIQKNIHSFRCSEISVFSVNKLWSHTRPLEGERSTIASNILAFDAGDFRWQSGFDNRSGDHISHNGTPISKTLGAVRPPCGPLGCDHNYDKHSDELFKLLLLLSSLPSAIDEIYDARQKCSVSSRWRIVYKSGFHSVTKSCGCRFRCPSRMP